MWVNLPNNCLYHAHTVEHAGKVALRPDNYRILLSSSSSRIGGILWTLTMQSAPDAVATSFESGEMATATIGPCTPTPNIQPHKQRRVHKFSLQTLKALHLTTCKEAKVMPHPPGAPGLHPSSSPCSDPRRGRSNHYIPSQRGLHGGTRQRTTPVHLCVKSQTFPM